MSLPWNGLILLPEQSAIVVTPPSISYTAIGAYEADAETLAPGEPATASIDATDPTHPILHLGIPAGQTGATGEQGIQGLPGDAATIAAGTTTTGAAGTDASVVNSGSSSAAIFDFTIPQGLKGDTGDTGATGATGPKGDKGDTGNAGTAATVAAGTTTTGAAGSDASVTNSGTSSAAVFDFTIPRGDKGETGDTGAAGSPGAAATVAAGTTTTGAAGSSASVTNSGTSSAAVFDFTIPRGDTGATGPTGAKGDKGDPGAGVAVGGTTGQALKKKSNTDYDTEWGDVLPSQSTHGGQFLKTDGSAASWNALAASDIASGTIATARLGSGTANATTYLRGDQTWAAVSGESFSPFLLMGA